MAADSGGAKDGTGGVAGRGSDGASPGKRGVTGALWSLKVPIGLVGAWFAFVILMRIFYVTPIPDITGPAIAHDHLSSEATEPFPIAKKRKDDALYYKFFRWKWPDARACLIAGEAAKPEPDLRRINWAKMRWAGDIEVCMWRIFASYGTPERARAWFEAQGLGGSLTEGVVLGKGSIGVSGANLPGENGGRRVPSSGLYSFIGQIIWAENFSAGFRENKVLNVSYGLTVE